MSGLQHDGLARVCCGDGTWDNETATGEKGRGSGQAGDKEERQIRMTKDGNNGDGTSS